jgi:hypothetical protein
VRSGPDGDVDAAGLVGAVWERAVDGEGPAFGLDAVRNLGLSAVPVRVGPVVDDRLDDPLAAVVVGDPGGPGALPSFPCDGDVAAAAWVADG